VNLWNSPPQWAVEAQSLSVFKAETDRFLNHNNTKGYGDSVGGKALKWMISPDRIEWRSRLDGLNGHLLCLCSNDTNIGSKVSCEEVVRRYNVI